jgi:endonuclease III
LAKKQETLRTRASQVARRLDVEYGSPNLKNKSDPLDELIFIILSQMTTGPSYERVFDRLKAKFHSWDDLLLTWPTDLRLLIGDAGLAGQKTPRLLAIARQLKADHGVVSLSPLAGASDRRLERYLQGLPGVGLKTAKCVMMYAFGRRVLPVDTHVDRVSRRLGLIPPDITGARAHATLERTVRPALRYGFHVNALTHGRQVCRALRPVCTACVVADLCPSTVCDSRRKSPK